MIVALDLPLPVSTNRIWRATHGRVIKSEEYRSWIAHAQGLFLTQKRGLKAIHGRFHAAIILNESMMRSNRDLDNIKCVLDFAKSMGLIVDDSIKYMRQLLITLGDGENAPEGCRLILKSVE